MLFQSVWNGEHIDAVISGAAADGRPADVLQREGLRAVDGVRQQGFKEHAGVGVLVVLQQSCDGGSVEDTGVVHVEAEVVVPLLDACVQRAAVAAEADGEEVVLLGRVAQEEGALGLALEELLGLIAVHHAPVARQVGDLEQVGDQAVDVVDLGVNAVAVVRFDSFSGGDYGSGGDAAGGLRVDQGIRVGVAHVDGGGRYHLIEGV